MTVPARLDIVTLGVSDMEASRRFYAGLGWEETTASTEQIRWFRTGGPYVGLFPLDELAGDAAVAPDRGGFPGLTFAINLPSEPDVDAALDAAARAGGTIVKPAQHAEWGGYSGYFADPDGYLWEVAYNPHFPFDDNGRVVIP